VSGFSKAKDRLDLLIALSVGSNVDPTKLLNPVVARNETVIEAVEHAPFRPEDVGRLLGIKTGASWRYARISSYRTGAAVAIEGDLGRAGSTAEWCMGIPHWILHDLRRTAATGMALLNVPPHVVDKILNHVSGTIRGVAAVYNRFEYIDERRQALEAWEKYVAALATIVPATADLLLDAAAQRAA
jgi:hypothetical protein